MIRLSKSCLGKNEINAVVKVLRKEHLGMGSEVQKFEEKLSKFFGRPVVCVVNGTAALHLALQACKIGAGDEVLVQSLTYVASFQAISATGATPVACDIDPETLTLDWRDAEKRLTKKTKAVMPVHYAGGVGDLEGIYRFAKRNGLRVIEDAAHAFGTVYKGKKVGSFGDISCFSFDGIKNITSGEGGCIVTNDKKVLESTRDTRLLGVQKDTAKRFLGKRSWEFQVKEQGWRYHMSNIMAAIGIQQLKKRAFLAKKRQKLAKYYDQILKNAFNIKRIHHNYKHIVPHIYVVQIKNAKKRASIRKKLEQQKIQTGIHWLPNHKIKFFLRHGKPLQQTEKIYHNILTLPLHPDLNQTNIKYICKKLKFHIS